MQTIKLTLKKTIKTDQDSKDYTVQGLEYERNGIKDAQYDRY